MNEQTSISNTATAIHPKIGVSGILRCDNRILLGKRLANDTQGGMWVTPGGGVEFGERLNVALEREFKEEVGLDVFILDAWTSIQQRIVVQVLNPKTVERHTVMIFKMVKLNGCEQTAVKGEEFCEMDWFLGRDIQKLWQQKMLTEMTYFAIQEFWESRYGTV